MLSGARSLTNYDNGQITRTGAGMAHKARTWHRLVLAILLAVVAPWPNTAMAVNVRAVALFANQAMLDIDGKQRLVKAGETTREGVTLVRSDSEGATVRIGEEVFALRLDARISGGEAAAPASQVVRLVPGTTGTISSTARSTASRSGSWSTPVRPVSRSTSTRRGGWGSSTA